MANNNNGMNLKVNVVLDPDQGYKEFNSWSNRVQAQANKNPIKVKIDLDGQQYEKSVETWIGKNHDLVEITKLVNTTTKKEIEYISKVEKGTERASRAIAQQNAATNALSNSQFSLNNQLKKSTTLFQDFANTFMKMAKFNTINIIYDNLTNSISNAVTVVKEFNDATTELRKVSDLEGESLKAYAQDLAEYGAEVGRTMTDMVNSATVFKRTGATDEEAKNLAKVAEMYRNVADNEISSAEAASFLVSQMKAFNITAKDSIHIIDAVNSVANAYAVNTNDLQTALAKSAAAMATAGNTYEETISLVEAGTAVMQGQAGTVGNGLRTIAINIANLATKSDEFVAANGKVAISLKDEKGEIRSTYEVLNDLSQNWDNLSRAEQNSIATTLAGKHKYIPRLARYKPI